MEPVTHGSVSGSTSLPSNAFAAPGAEQVGDLGQLVDAAPGALPDQQRHLLPGVEQVRRGPHRGRVRGGGRPGRADAGGDLFELVPGRFVLQVEHVRRDDHAGRGVLGQGDPDRPVDQIRQLLRAPVHICT